MTDLSKLTREEILARRAKALSELADVLAELAGENTAAGASAGSLDPVDPAKAGLEDQLRRLPLGEAVIEYLKSCKGPQTAKQVAGALRKAGREFETDRPVRAVKDALKKSCVKNKDLFHVRWATWYLRSKCTKARYTKLIGANATFGTGGRAPAEHGDRTRNGMLKARDEGKQIGARLKGNPEMYALIRKTILDGGTIGDACRRSGISVGTFNTYRKIGLLGDLPTKPGRRKAKPRTDRDLLSGVDAGAGTNLSDEPRLRIVK